MKKVIFLICVLLVFKNTVQAQTEIVSTGSGSAYAIAYPAAFSYSAGITLVFKAHITSAVGPVTLNVNGISPKTIKKNVQITKG